MSMNASNIKLWQIRIIRKLRGIQMNTEELHSIISVIEKIKPCNLLVFGVGNDSSLWIRKNSEGRTAFIEDSLPWFNKIKSRNKGMEAYVVDYGTIRTQWKELLNKPKKLWPDMPKYITKTKWDVVIVDAPAGWQDDKPGRMKSIYVASRLIKKHGHVFVHDCGRVIEKTYSNKFLKKRNLYEEICGLRHYIIKW